MTNWETVIAGCKKSDGRAMSEAYRRAWPMVFPGVLGILGNREEAEDLMHEGFLKGFERLNNLKNPETYPAWQRQICVRMALNKYRNRLRHVYLETLPDVADEEEEPNMLPELLPERLTECLDRLPEGQRIIVRLVLAEQMTHEAVAEQLGITASASRSQYSRGLKKLRHEIIHTHEPSH
jgi:RNA polymerase sigma factor (sigma-70 family)